MTSLFLIWLPSAYLTLCCKGIQISPDIKILISGTFRIFDIPLKVILSGTFFSVPNLANFSSFHHGMLTVASVIKLVCCKVVTLNECPPLFTIYWL